MKLTLKKKSNCNIVALWFYHKITFVITFHNILLSLLIVLTYFLFLPDYIPNILNLIYLLLGIGFFLLHCWKTLNYYHIIEKRTSFSSYCNFDFYLPILYLLELDFLLSGSIEIQITPQILANLKRSTKQNQSRMVACIRRMWLFFESWVLDLGESPWWGQRYSTC